MPFRIIRRLSQALALLLALVTPTGPAMAGEDIFKLKPASPLSGRYLDAIENGKQVTLVPIILDFQLPNMTTMERMEYIRLLFLNLKLKHKQKTGQAVTFGRLEVTSSPPGAGVWISSYTPKGVTPFSKDKVLSGLHRVTVRKQGYYQQARMVTVAPGKPASLDFKLKPIPYARLTLEVSPADTKVTIVGYPDKYTPGMKVKPGGYVVRFSHPRLGDKSLFISLADNQVLKQRVDLAAPAGSLWVNATQPDCTVYLDGQEAGRSSLGIVGLLPGLHKLQVWKSLFKPVTRVALVEPGREMRMSVGLKPAEHFTNSLGMEFVKIPAGSFMMGYRDHPDVMAKKTNDIFPHSTFLDGNPRHRVEITKPFFMQTTEVTNEQWRLIMKGHIYPPKRPAFAYKISEADDFIAKLNEREQGKYRYRLPTEVEWEYACRAGTDSPFYTGETLRTDQANTWVSPEIDGEYGVDAKVKRSGYSLPVKSFSPNPWGLYDMHGNRDELCSDVYDPFFNARAPIRDPQNPGPKNLDRTVRDGSAAASVFGTMCAQRIYYSGYHKMEQSGVGFRLVAEELKHPGQ